jgi:hypothetical protein
MLSDRIDIDTFRMGWLSAMNSDSEARAGGWWPKIALFSAVCFISVLLFEGGLRLAGVSFPVFDTYDETLGTKLMPGKAGWYRKEGEAFLEINSLGYRDVEHDLEADFGAYRIAVLGDSFTEARQMPIEETYWHRLAQDLKTCPALDGRSVEVMSFGIGGYSTTQSLLAYEHDARRFEPDLVLLGFFPGNDVRENSEALFTSNTHYFSPRPFHHLVNGELTLSPPEPLSILNRAMMGGVQHSRFLELVNEARRNWKVRQKRAAQEQRIQTVEVGLSALVFQPLDALPDLAEAWDLTEYLLAELDRKVRNDGARFMVASIPSAIQTHPDKAFREGLIEKLGVDDLLFPERQLEAIGEEYGFPAFPMVAELQAAAGDRHIHGFPNTGYGYGHLNPLGHQELADRLAPKVCEELKKGLVPLGHDDGLAWIDIG